jgi:hypothetical protein
MKKIHIYKYLTRKKLCEEDFDTQIEALNFFKKNIGFNKIKLIKIR